MKSLLRIAVFGILYYVVCAFAASLLQAQELPDAPQPKETSQQQIVPSPRFAPSGGHHRAVWIAETAAVGALLAADYSITAVRNHKDACVPNCNGLPYGPHAEGDWLYGRYPSNARLAATGAVIFAATAFTLRKAENSHHPFFRFAGRILAAGTGIVEVQSIHSWKNL